MMAVLGTVHPFTMLLNASPSAPSVGNDDSPPEAGIGSETIVGGIETDMATDFVAQMVEDAQAEKRENVGV